MEGSCHCGAIRFKVKGDPTWLGACYCVDCRKISGSPYMAFAAYKKDQIKIIGNPKKYQSSKNVTRSFCEMCGSPITYADTEIPGIISISIGIFNDPNSLEPQEHIWVSQKLPWIHINDDKPQK